MRELFGVLQLIHVYQISNAPISTFPPSELNTSLDVLHMR